MLKGSLLRTFKTLHRRVSYSYAFFLVFVTPIAIPLCIWTVCKGWVCASDIYVALLFYCLSGLGITLGYHRLITHRAFETSPILKRFLLIIGTFAMQGAPASWASLHIQHHRFADKSGDPHSPQEQSFWHAHCGWIFHHYTPDFRRFGKWLLRDKEIKHVSRYYIYYSHLGLLIPLLLGGWVGLVWGRITSGFFIESCHLECEFYLSSFWITRVFNAR